MREVAALAGVSIKTVSRVINGESGVTVELVGRVDRAIAQLDYRPNLSASHLRRLDRTTATIGALLEDVANPFSSAVHRAIEDVARQRRVMVLTGSLDEDPEREQALVHNFASRRVDGLVIMAAGADHSYLVAERRAGLPIVFIDRPPAFFDADAVLSANREGSRSGVRHLIAGGHRRIAFLGDLASIYTAGERLAGYFEALHEVGTTPDGDLVRQNLHTADLAEAATLELLALARPPTAIFASQNLVTMGAVKALRTLGRQHSVALVGFDDFLLADLLEPGVTVVAQDPTTLGTQAAELLFRRLDGDHGPSRTVVVDTWLVTRGSGEVPPPH
jgi:LacI family transcriptional regulator